MARSGSGIRRGVAPRFVEVAKPLTAPTPTAPVAQPSNVHYTEKFAAPAVVLAPVNVEDIDRLWDWCRTDHDGTKDFLGESFVNSRDLFAFIGQLAGLERSGHAAFFAIREGVNLFGFVMLSPIIRQAQPIGTLAVYLESESRARLKAILPSILSEADRVAPNVNLCVVTQRGDWASLLESFGFVSHTVLTRFAPPMGNAI